jgi:hypothetical protein
MNSQEYQDWVKDELDCMDLEDQFDLLMSDEEECEKIMRGMQWDFQAPKLW